MHMEKGKVWTNNTIIFVLEICRWHTVLLSTFITVAQSVKTFHCSSPSSWPNYWSSSNRFKEDAEASAVEPQTLHTIQRTEIVYRDAYVDNLEVDYSTERSSRIVQETGKKATEPSPTEILAAEGSLADLSANNEWHPTNQKVIMMIIHKNCQQLDTVFTIDTRVPLCPKKES